MKLSQRSVVIPSEARNLALIHPSGIGRTTSRVTGATILAESALSKLLRSFAALRMTADGPGPMAAPKQHEL